MSEVIAKSFKDFLSPRIFMTSISSLGITIFIVLLSLYFAFDGFSAIKNEIMLVFKEGHWLFFEDFKDSFIVDFLIKHAIFSIMLNFLFILGFGLVIYYIFFMIYSFVIGFFSGVVIDDIKQKYYADIELNGLSISATIWFYIKTIFIAVVLFLLLLPFYFIPVLNLLIFLPMYYFFHKTLVYDVSSIINTKDEYKSIIQTNWIGLKIKTFLCFMIALIPIIGIILYPFYIVYISHFIFEQTKLLRQPI
ncbi:EI24 domain-containing protein [Arcobacter sp. FWKO B]|uniref:EI24 domain-containing protein n=1 Tax=Arcobacter sp. FWKO B TaxID=2593672 RepID=UPI0018A414D5|nr:EI24 domain-containing protein [Arcobacter sp. FWKO B]QOG11304.1 hypothetical protein FWKOB_00720 [Arcobacter sp. FWKO B]